MAQPQYIDFVATFERWFQEHGGAPQNKVLRAVLADYKATTAAAERLSHAVAAQQGEIDRLVDLLTTVIGWRVDAWQNGGEFSDDEMASFASLIRENLGEKIDRLLEDPAK